MSTLSRSRLKILFAALLVVSIVLVTGCGSADRSSQTSSSSPADEQSVSSDSNGQQTEKITFDGKTVEIIINFSAGGPTDLFGRLIVRHLEKYLPGNPTIVVKNVPGAGGVLGTNTIYNSKPDGLTIAILSDPMSKQIVDEAAQYKVEEFAWLGGISETSVVYAHPDLGLNEPKDIVSPKKQIIFGGLGQIESRDFTIRNMLEYLDVDYKYVTGYPGNAESRQAYASGEINFTAESLSGYFTAIEPWVKEGTAVPFAQFGLVDANSNVIRDDRVGELPTLVEVMKEVKGESALSGDAYDAAVLMATLPTLLRAIVGPPGMPEEITAAWREAMEATLNDPAFLEEGASQLGIELSTLSGEEAQQISESVFRYIEEHPGALRYLKELAGIS